jgi:hypothetical protein
MIPPCSPSCKRQVRGNIEKCVVRRVPDLCQPVRGYAPGEKIIVGAIGEQPWRRGGLCFVPRSRSGHGGRRTFLDVLRHHDFAGGFPDLDELRGAGRGMRLQLPPLGPRVGIIVMADVAEEQAAACAVNDQPDVAVHAHRPEVPVFRAVEPVELHARAGGVELEVERGRLYRLLLIGPEAGQARGKRVGDAEFHLESLELCVAPAPTLGVSTIIDLTVLDCRSGF